MAVPLTRRAVLATLLFLGVVGAGCSSTSSTDVHAAAPSTTGAATVIAHDTAPPPTTAADTSSTTSTSTTTEAPTTTTEAPTTTTTAPPLSDHKLSPGEHGPEVGLLQLRLAELGYRPGDPDGNYGGATSSAVLAFQKREGLSRDGIAGTDVLERLQAPIGIGPRSMDPGPRIEVDLDRQIAFIFPGDGSYATVNVSTGSGQRYRVPGGGTAVAYTPTGTFSVLRRINGPDKGPLGVLYRPLYFKGGWAVHGSGSVPAYPASHGCVRVSNADQNWIYDAIPNGATVTIYKPSAEDAPPPPDAGAGD